MEVGLATSCNCEMGGVVNDRAANLKLVASRNVVESLQKLEILYSQVAHYHQSSVFAAQSQRI